MTEVRVSRIHYPVDVLGPGRRVGIWFQGCSIGCPGCLSRDTWDPDGGQTTSVHLLVESVLRLCGRGPVDGVTISGGEPFEQPDALRALIPPLRRSLGGLAPTGEIDVMVYSGMRSAVLHRDHPGVLAEIDVIIPEPYRQGAGPGGRWRGSANQTVEVLSELGRQRFSGELALGPGEMRRSTGTTDEGDTHAPTIQIAVEDDAIWMVGIPRPGDLPRLEALLSEEGIDLWQASWRP